MLVLIGSDVDPRLPGMRKSEWDAWDPLARWFPIASTRTGWDYANDATMLRLESFGVRVDFSAIPGHIVWWTVDGQRFVVDWRRSPRVPYRPSRSDYQRPGSDALRILEV